MKKQEKEAVVQKLREKVEKASFAAVTDFRGVNVAKMTELRTEMREAGAHYQVVKNTLLIRASDGTDLEGLKEHFEGPCALALAFEDPVPTAKVLTKFQADNKKVFAIKGGILEGKTLDEAGIKALSDLPSREVLLGQALSAMNAVPTGLVRVLNAVPQKLVYALQAIADQKGEAA